MHTTHKHYTTIVLYFRFRQFSQNLPGGKTAEKETRKTDSPPNSRKRMGKGGTKNKEKRTPGKTKRKKKRIKKQEKRKQPKQDMEKTWEGFQLRSSDVMPM